MLEISNDVAHRRGRERALVHHRFRRVGGAAAGEHKQRAHLALTLPREWFRGTPVDCGRGKECWGGAYCTKIFGRGGALTRRIRLSR